MLHSPSQLSGRHQTVLVAFPLAGEHSVLLTDDPTGKLDSKNGTAVIELLRNVRQGGATICMAT